jgi:NAD(P)-dependent dehydrogenase (short-subunit alcohol dehydrogenase family)
MNAVVVTGVSSGIGQAIARVLAAKGFHVFGSVRKPADAEPLTRELTSFTPLVFDVTDEASVVAAAQTVRAALSGRKLAGLVNNAGIAVPGPVLHQPMAVYRKQIEVNLIGPYLVSQAFAPLLGADRSLDGAPGRVVNITSLGGKIGAPLLAGYCSAKHGLEGLSECMRRELIGYGIDVVIVGPGAVRTPIWDKASDHDESYRDTDYASPMKALEELMRRASETGLAPERVGEIVHTALTARRPAVRYALAPDYFFDWIVPRVLPRRWVDAVFAKRLGLLGSSIRQV